ncbi:XRE family transcriptional regulator [Lachnospiraceae bacterium 54-53]
MIYDHNLAEFLNQLQHLMLDDNTKQIDIVKASGLTQATVSNIFNMRRDNVTLDTLQTIVNAAGYDIDIQLIKRN